MAAITLPAGCGSGERTFSAREFVEEANHQGAGLELGIPLSSGESGDELYAVEVGSDDAPAKQQGPPESPTGVGPEHAGGSLRVSESADEAEDEYARCEAAVTLLCYRAANVVLILDDGADPADLRSVERALMALESG